LHGAPLFKQAINFCIGPKVLGLIWFPDPKKRLVLGYEAGCLLRDLAIKETSVVWRASKHISPARELALFLKHRLAGLTKTYPQYVFNYMGLVGAFKQHLCLAVVRWIKIM